MGIKENAFARFNQLLADEGDITKRLPVGAGYKYVVFSDLHMGDGSRADNFRKNEDVLVKALKHYKRNKYSVILLGDIEEFHQFTLFHIYRRYANSVYKALKEFVDENTYRVFGNHDIDWALEDPISEKSNTISTEAIKLGNNIIITHGHQAMEGYEEDLHIVRLGTTFFKMIENLFSSENKLSIAQLPGKKDKIYADWAKENRKIFICGHTHAPVFMGRSMYEWMNEKIPQLKDEIDRASKNENKQKKLKNKRRRMMNYRRSLEDKQKAMKKPFLKLKSPYYFNPGSGIFKDGITNIEIDETRMRLIFWSNKDLSKEQIWGYFDISNFV
jgi:predicted phosphodiesterase